MSIPRSWLIDPLTHKPDFPKLLLEKRGFFSIVLAAAINTWALPAERRPQAAPSKGAKKQVFEHDEKADKIIIEAAK